MIHTSQWVYIWPSGWTLVSEDDCPLAFGVFSESSAKWCYNKDAKDCRYSGIKKRPSILIIHSLLPGCRWIWIWGVSRSWQCVRHCCCPAAWDRVFINATTVC